ncbi:MAG: PucR family transcriptional regulator ligand-binding domain-containing protein [Anaerostipes sp.]|jgi:predicted DNA-binding protein YlxM (UPF0122 family)|nr:PucR family transcriptional regulator ligand-binding domain-containing protein [Anaerostipes sp.]MDD3747364.1 PucR family transcriptional regulator ligand-binding domain-containing protein [Anaerostipes sp.]
MAISLENLYESTKDEYKLNLVAGASGMDHVITWVQYTEDIDTNEFLRGNELIIITGLTATGDNWLFHFIESLVDNNISGLIINTGRYIKDNDITSDIISLCDHNDLPLFLMPWEIHLADIMHDYCNRLFQNNYRIDSITSAIQGIIFDPIQYSHYRNILNDYQISEYDLYNVVNIQNSDGILSDFQVHLLEKQLNRTRAKYLHFLRDNTLTVVFYGTSEVCLNDLIEVILQSNLPLVIGIGNTAHDLTKLRDCYRESNFALSQAKKSNQTIVFFEQLGVYQILFQVDDKEFLKTLYKNRLGILETQDELHHSNLMETLELYLLEDGSIKAVADKLYTHRNTINYRMKKIHQILGESFDNPEQKFQYQLAFHIRKYLS